MHRGRTLDGLPRPAFPTAMDDTPRLTAAAPSRTETTRDARLEREAAALRENLRRRKQQARERAGPPKPEST